MRKMIKEQQKKPAAWLRIDSANGAHGTDFRSTTVAKVAGVDDSTARRWAVAGIPQRALGWLRLMLLGELPWARWRGWQIGDGWLQGPEGRAYDTDSLNATWIMWQQLSDARQRVEALEADRAALRTALLSRPCTRRWGRRRTDPTPVQLTLLQANQQALKSPG
jgi:hypothetical protein